MMRRVRNAVLSWRVIGCFLISSFIICLTRNEMAFSFSYLGGVVLGGSLDIVSIIRWNVCVLAPVALSWLYFAPQLGPLCVYTMIRSGNIRRWLIERLTIVVILNFIYPLFNLCISCVEGIYTAYYAMDILKIYILFVGHTLMVSLISIVAFVLCRSAKAAVYLFAGFEIIGICVGSIIPSLAPYLPSFWGMYSTQGASAASMSCMLLVILGSCIVLAIHFSRRNPTVDHYLF